MTSELLADLPKWRHPAIFSGAIGSSLLILPVVVNTGSAPDAWWPTWWVLFAVAAGFSLSGSV